MGIKVIRSTLIVPITMRKFVEKAHLRGADAIMLDLEDSIPLSEKAKARLLVKKSVELLARAGSYVGVRINNETSHLDADLDASVCQGLDFIALPKVETAEEVGSITGKLAKLEQDRGIPEGRIKLSLIIETPCGVLHLEDIALSSARIESMGIGPEDYCRELGVEPSPDGAELFYPVSRLVTVCKAAGVRPTGLLGSIAGYGSLLEGFERAVLRGRQLGCEGSGCIHPEQVPIINRAFTPALEDVDKARQITCAFEDAMKEGKASVSVHNKMVDIPVYKRAQHIVERYETIKMQEKEKEDLIAALTNLCPGG